MDKIMAVCGLVCNECLAFMATQEDDDVKREEVVRLWSTEEESLRKDDVDCDGCLAGGRLYKFCGVCEPRLCAIDKGLENCARCGDYPCEKLENLWNGFRTASKEKARANLDRIRKGAKI